MFTLNVWDYQDVIEKIIFINDRKYNNISRKKINKTSIDINDSNRSLLNFIIQQNMDQSIRQG